MPHVDTPQSACDFGVARCDITPPVGIYHRLWGAATHERAAGVHRPLQAAAAVFRSTGQAASIATEQIVVAVDHCLLWGREMDSLLGQVSHEAGLDRSQITVAFSHTHSAGLLGLERLKLPGGELIPPYLEQLAARITDLVKRARHDVRPATVCYGVSRSTMAGQRDLWDSQSRQYVCGFNPDATADDTVLVARVAGLDGRPRATFVNYACHPTTLAWQNQLISPDFIGAMREVVERVFEVPCLFLQGASGDLGPRDGFVGDTAVADRNGRLLGYAALAALESLPSAGTRFTYTGPVVSGATLGTWAHVPLGEAELRSKAQWQMRRWNVDLPYRPELPNAESTRAERLRWSTDEQAAIQAGDAIKARDCHAMVERMDRQLNRLIVLPPGPNFPLPVTLWRMGDAFWLAVEAEHYQLLQTAVRARFPAVPIMVITIANGSRAIYVPTADTYGKGIYQESIAVLAPGSLERLIDVVAGQIAGWLPK
jgi:hypothetical protein